MLILEDGSGLPNSNSYADVAAFTAYCADRDIIVTADNAKISASLIRATDRIDADYVFRSVRATDVQALENPRYGQTALHPKLVHATIELALIATTRELFPPLMERGVQSKETTVGSITVKTAFDAVPVTDPYPAITAILKAIASRRGASASFTVLTQ